MFSRFVTEELSGKFLTFLFARSPYQHPSFSVDRRGVRGGLTVRTLQQLLELCDHLVKVVNFVVIDHCYVPGRRLSFSHRNFYNSILSLCQFRGFHQETNKWV